MFQGLFRRAESTIDNAVAKLIGRAAVAVPLLIASGFASAALTVWLIERYGAITACGMMSALFCVIALLTMAVVSTNGSQTVDAVSQPQAAAGDTVGEKSADTDVDPMELLTPEVRTFLASVAPMAIPAVARGVGRNLPLIFILALMGFVISRFAAQDVETGPTSSDTDAPPPDMQDAAVAAASVAAA